MSDDLESRLVAWGAAEVAAAGEPPYFDVMPRPRRWVPALAAAAAVLVAGGSGLVLAEGHRTARVPAVHAQVVPWADLRPAPEPVFGISPQPTADPRVRACAAADLRASEPDPGEGAGGSWIGSLALTNASATPCRLTGRLEGLTGVLRGVRHPIRVAPIPTTAFDSAPVVLAPGEAGRVVFTYYPRCDNAMPRGWVSPVYRDLRISLLGGVLAVAGASIDLGCDRPGTGVSAGTLGGELVDNPQVVPPAWVALVPTLQAPHSVRAGEVLRYEVTLTNLTGVDVALDPCPNLLQALGTATKGLWGLHCAAAHPVPAYGSETFAMELAVPADLAGGPTRLTWSLTGAGTRSAFADVEVTR